MASTGNDGGRRQSDAARAPSKRGLGFTDIEITALLELLEDALPVTAEAWEAIAVTHEKNGFPRRPAGSLRRKFHKLVRKRVSINDLHVPANVMRAMRIRQRMVAATANVCGPPIGDDDITEEAAPSEDTDGDDRDTTRAPAAGLSHEQDLQQLLDRFLARAEDDRREREEDRRRREEEQRQWYEVMHRQRDEMMRMMEHMGARAGRHGGAGVAGRVQHDVLPGQRHGALSHDQQLLRLLERAIEQAEGDRREREVERRMWREEIRQRDEMMRVLLTTVVASLSGRRGSNAQDLET